MSKAAKQKPSTAAPHHQTPVRAAASTARQLSQKHQSIWTPPKLGRGQSREDTPTKQKSGTKNPDGYATADAASRRHLRIRSGTSPPRRGCCQSRNEAPTGPRLQTQSPRWATAFTDSHRPPSRNSTPAFPGLRCGHRNQLPPSTNSPSTPPGLGCGDFSEPLPPQPQVNTGAPRARLQRKPQAKVPL